MCRVECLFMRLSTHPTQTSKRTPPETATANSRSGTPFFGEGDKEKGAKKKRERDKKGGKNTKKMILSIIPCHQPPRHARFPRFSQYTEPNQPAPNQPHAIPLFPPLGVPNPTQNKKNQVCKDLDNSQSVITTKEKKLRRWTRGFQQPKKTPLSTKQQKS